MYNIFHIFNLVPFMTNAKITMLPVSLSKTIAMIQTYHVMQEINIALKESCYTFPLLKFLHFSPV